MAGRDVRECHVRVLDVLWCGSRTNDDELSFSLNSEGGQRGGCGDRLSSGAGPPRLRIVPADRIEVVHVAGCEVRERHVVVLDVPRSACARDTGRKAHVVLGQRASDKPLVIGCQRDLLALVFKELRDDCWPVGSHDMAEAVASSR